MSSVLAPVEQRVVAFYDDEIAVVLVNVDDRQVVYVPIRPLCEFLGVDWSGQRQRLERDPVLSEEMRGVVVTPTPLSSKFANPQEMICLPLDFVNGFLFGINASRVKIEVKANLIRYQRECYRVLADAFSAHSMETAPTAAGVSPSASLLQVREMGLAIARMAEEQIEFDGRLTKTESRLDKAAAVFGGLTKRITALEERIAPGDPVTMEQASEISQAVKAIAMKLGERSGRNEFGGVYGRLYEKFGITSYKLLPVEKFADAMKFLTEWYVNVTGNDAPF